MSWLLAADGRLDSDQKNMMRSLAPEPIFLFESENIFILSGGLPSTCLASESSSAHSGWIICGTGIHTGSTLSSIITSDEWNNLLMPDHIDLDSAEGQYAGIRWQNNTIEGFTDQIGLRDLYSFSDKNYKIFSTRLDWI